MSKQVLTTLKRYIFCINSTLTIRFLGLSCFFYTIMHFSALYLITFSNPIIHFWKALLFLFHLIPNPSEYGQVESTCTCKS